MILSQLDQQYMSNHSIGQIGMSPVTVARMQLQSGGWQAALHTLRANYDESIVRQAWAELIAEPNNAVTIMPAGQSWGRRPAGQIVTGRTFTLSDILMFAGAALGAYHGYKRNDSVGWGIVWGAAGAVLPVITVGVAVIQGYAKPVHG